MIVGIVQPYFYPYPHYFELIRRVDLFIIYDDVQYVSRRWINRNRIRARTQRGWRWLTIPVRKHHHKTLICDIAIAYNGFEKDLFSTLRHTYSMACERHPLYLSLRSALERRPVLLVDLLEWTLRDACAYLGISTPFRRSSQLTLSPGSASRGVDRILQLCQSVGATSYLNPAGGKAIYDHDRFAAAGLRLDFMPPPPGDSLSILDACLGGQL